MAELSGHLRALLRDVLCGHLDPDLRAVAEEMLADDVCPGSEPGVGSASVEPSAFEPPSVAG